MTITASSRNLVLKDYNHSLKTMAAMDLLPQDINQFATVGGLIIWGLDQALAENRLEELEEKLKTKPKKQQQSDCLF